MNKNEQNNLILNLYIINQKNHAKIYTRGIKKKVHSNPSKVHILEQPLGPV